MVELFREDTSALPYLLRALADHLRLNGIDRWLGGVHLHGDRVWRWDGEHGKLELTTS